MTWDELEVSCRNCKKCSLYETRTNLVFGTGARDAEVLFIGEGPGEQEDKQGLPFVGRAGKLLDDMLEMINLSRTKNVYIANIVKCRPPNNRDPLKLEQTACIDWLKAQVKLLRPKVIVCLGRIAAGIILKGEDSGAEYKISREHGQWTERGGVMMTAIYHPAALLRDPNRRPETFVDLKDIERVIRETCRTTYND